MPTASAASTRTRCSRPCTRGEIRPLAEVLAAAERVSAWPSDLASKVKRKRGRIVYELKIIAERGRVRELYIDAATLEVFKAE